MVNELLESKNGATFGPFLYFRNKDFATVTKWHTNLKHG